MMRKICLAVVIALAITIFVPNNSNAAWQSTTQIYIDEQTILYSTNTGVPFVDKANRTQVPFRAVLEKFGAKVSYDSIKRIAFAEKDGIKIGIPIGKAYITVNGKIIQNDTSAVMVDKKTYVPIRKIMESFGCEVTWDLANNSIFIKTNGSSNINHILKVNLNNAMPDESLVSNQSRYSKVQVMFDPSVPIETQEYIKQLTALIDPAIRKFIGEPIRSGNFTLKYDPKATHTSLSVDKTLMTFTTLPNTKNGTDQTWDDIYLINYIHPYIVGGSIPIQGVRYGENLAHPIKELVAEYLTINKIRSMQYKGINYYIAAYPAFSTMKAEVVLEQGPTDGEGSSFEGNNFALDNDTYSRFNVFAIEYAKSVWLTAAYARYLETGKVDFFYQLKEQLVEKNPQIRSGFETIMESLTGGIQGMTAAQWMQKQAFFKGFLDKDMELSLFVADGDFSNTYGRNNPDYIYPIIMKRTPGKLVNADVKITVTNESGEIKLEQTILSDIKSDGSTHGVLIPKGLLKPGKYSVRAQCSIESKLLEDIQTFYIFDTEKADGYWMGFEDIKPVKNTSISISFDSSVPLPVQSYITDLIKILDPAMRKIAGEPLQNNHMTIKYDSLGMNGMNADTTILNMNSLPEIRNGVDANFDSFFFIEYFHMFHRGTNVPIENVRYNENISQAMKIVSSQYLKLYSQRQVSDPAIPYYLDLHDILNTLGPGVLVNNGPSIGNPGGGEDTDPRSKWLSSGKFQLRANSFLMEYSLTTWLRLADAYQERHGDYGFFRELLNALSVSPPSTKAEYFSMIDEMVDSKIAGLSPSEWLKATALYQEIPVENYFIKPLPANSNGDSIFATGKPNCIIPFAVSRVSYAKIIDSEYLIIVKNASGKTVLSTTIKPIEGDGRLLIKPVSLPVLPTGEYMVYMTVNCDGRFITGEQSFSQ